MTNLLIRLFIKDAGNTDSPAVREKYGLLGGIVGIFCNLLLSSAKIAAGIFTASISILADGLNNLSDMGSSVVTMAGFKLAGKTPDKEHPFGHGRMEYVAGLLVALVILLMGVELGKSSIEKIINPQTLDINLAAVLILILSVLVKLWMFLFNRTMSRRIHSAAMAATAKDSLSDAAATAVVLLSVLVYHFTGWNVDGWAGLLVALFILYTGFSAAKDTLDPLLGQAPNPEFAREIEQAVLAHPEIVGVHELIVHDYGPGRCMISLHAEVPASMEVLEAHDAIDRIENELQAKFHCVATLHMDPIVTDNEFTNALKVKIQGFLEEISPELTMHDFRITDGPMHKNLIFDIVLPQKFQYPADEVVKQLKDRIRRLDKTYYAVIKVDRSYL